MRISESCAKCLYDRQAHRCPDPGYLAEVREMIESRGDDESSPLLVYRFNQAYVRRFGPADDYREIKRRYDDLALGLRDGLRQRIAASPDPVKAALGYARVGNYIDFGAMDSVDEATFLSLFEGAGLRPEEEPVYAAFLAACAGAERFLLVADNCGEIVLDMLLIERLALRFPRLKFQVMVRGGEILNDATLEDARHVGLETVAEVIPSGAAVGGAVYALMSDEARRALDGADVILAKGQGNYESLSGQGRPAFYAFLCKCDLFTRKFGVPLLTGMFVKEEGLEKNP